eukprot:scaffold2885_cov65-Phaeocystis_antarctica.AAC.5
MILNKVTIVVHASIYQPQQQGRPQSLGSGSLFTNTNSRRRAYSRVASRRKHFAESPLPPPKSRPWDSS